MTIRRGDKNPQVLHLQSALMATGIPLPQYGVDGIFGPETEAAVKKLQQKMGLPQTGVADPQLLARLGIDAHMLQVSPNGFGSESYLWLIGGLTIIAAGIAIKKIKRK